MSEQDAPPSSTEPGILTEIVDEFKSLGDKVEHLIRPNAPAADAAVNSQTQASPSAPDAASTGDAADSSQPTQNASAGGPTGTEDPNASLASTSSEASALSSSTEKDLDPNAAATPAADHSASDTSSSASPASPVVGTLAAIDSGVLSRARLAIDRLRAHFWTFEASAVQKMHTELDFLEGLFK